MGVQTDLLWATVGTGAATMFSAAATAVMAWKTSKMAGATKDAADAGLREARAVEDQGEFIKQQAMATAEQSGAVSQQAKAAAEQVSLTRESLLASTQPWLSVGDTLVSTLQDGSTWREPAVDVRGSALRIPGADGPAAIEAHLHVVNIGAGIAVVNPKYSRIVGCDPDDALGRTQMPFTSATVERPLVAPKDQAWLHWDVPLAQWRVTYEHFVGRGRGGGGVTPTVAFDVSYGDLAGQQQTIARFHVIDDGGDEWHCFRVEYRRAGEDEPFLTTHFQ